MQDIDYMTRRDCELYHKLYETYFANDKKSIENLTNAGMESAMTQTRIMTILEQNGERLAKIETDIEAFKDKPGKRWETIVMFVISTIVGGCIVYIMDLFLRQ